MKSQNSTSNAYKPYSEGLFGNQVGEITFKAENEDNILSNSADTLNQNEDSEIYIKLAEENTKSSRDRSTLLARHSIYREQFFDLETETKIRRI